MVDGGVPAARPGAGARAAILGPMLDSIRGTLLSRDPSGCVIEAGGVGLAVLVPLSTFERLPAPGKEAALRLHLVVREDEWRLFGFSTEEERRLFRSCLKVSGVGPATALALLSGMSPQELRAAVVSGDVRALTRVKGVGKKTAERLVVELKDALAEGGLAKPSGGLSGTLGEAAAALVALGLDSDEAAQRLRRVRDGAALPVAELVRRALRG